MLSTATYTTAVNRIKQKVLFDFNLDALSCICHDWEDFTIEIAEWGIYKLAGVDFDTLTTEDLARLDQFIKNQNGGEY